MAKKVVIPISVRPDSKLRRALNGTVSASRKASEQVRKDDKRQGDLTLAEKKRLAAKAVTVARRMAASVQRESKKTALAQIKDANKAAAAQVKAAKKAADAQVKEAKRAAKQSRDSRQRIGGAVAGAALGAAAGATALAGRGQQLAGVESTEQRLSNAASLEALLVGTASEALGDKGTADSVRALKDELTSLVVNVSKQYQVDANLLGEALAESQTGFAQLDDFKKILPEIAALTKASVGSVPKDFVKLVGVIADANQLTVQEMRQLPAIIKETSAQGAINPKEMAEALGPSLKVLSATTKRGGLGGVRESLAFAQTLGTSKARAPVVATMIEQIMARLGKLDVREGFAKLGVQVSKETPETLDRARRGKKAREGAFQGDLLPLGQILENLKAQESEVLKPGVLGGLVDQEVAKAFVFLLQAGPEKFKEVAGAQGGQADIDRTVDALTTSKFGKLQQLRVDAAAKTIEDADELVDAITPMATALTELQTEFPILSESVGTLAGAVGGLAAAVIGQKFLGGGGAAGGAVGAAGAAAGPALLSRLGAGAAGAAGLVGSAGAGLMALAGGSVAGAIGVGLIPGALLSLGLEATGGNDALMSFGGSFAGGQGQGPTTIAGTRKLDESVAKLGTAADKMAKAAATPNKVEVKVKDPGGAVQGVTTTSGGGMTSSVDAGMSTVQP